MIPTFLCYSEAFETQHQMLLHEFLPQFQTDQMPFVSLKSTYFGVIARNRPPWLTTYEGYQEVIAQEDINMIICYSLRWSTVSYLLRIGILLHLSLDSFSSCGWLLCPKEFKDVSTQYLREDVLLHTDPFTGFVLAVRAHCVSLRV